MRVEHIEFRISRQRSYRDSIIKAYPNLIQGKDGNLSKNRIETRLEAFTDLWSQFHINHQAINLAISKLDSKKKKKLQKLSYFKKNRFSSTYEHHLETIERMKELRDKHQGITQIVGSSASSIDATSSTTACHSSRIPRIDLPKFNGTLSDGHHFKGLLTSLVISNPNLSSVEKLQYLKTSLVGSAPHLLKNTASTSDNFLKAWDAVFSFYENLRLLVNSELQSLFSMKKMSRECAVELERLYTSTLQVIRCLETLQRPVQHWDDFLIFMTVQKLDSESVKMWEQFQGSTKEPSTWPRVREFLLSRMQALQAFEHSRGSTSSTPNSRPAAHSHASTIEYNDRGHSEALCPMCSDNHSIYRCPFYKLKSLEERKAFITWKRLCFNCLGDHYQSQCRSTKRCLICGKRHHTKLHQTTLDLTKNPNPRTPQHSMNPPREADSRSVSYAHQTLKDTTVILLATAQVEVVNQYNEILRVRALLDQGSEVSLVTENLVPRLHLPRSASSVALLGIGAQSSNRSKGLVSSTIRPPFSSSISVNVRAHILSKLTSMIPAVHAPSAKWFHIEDLTLADPKFTEPGTIDLILGADIQGHLLLEEAIKRGSLNSPVAQSTSLGWILSGPSGILSNTEKVHSYRCSIDHDLDESLEKFWHQEETPSNKNQ